MKELHKEICDNCNTNNGKNLIFCSEKCYVEFFDKGFDPAPFC